MTDQPRPPGLFYDARRDALRVHLAPWTDDAEVDMDVGRVEQPLAPDSTLRLLAMVDRGTALLRVVVLARASEHLPSAVLRRAGAARLEVHVEPTNVMVPFFADAVSVTKRVHMFDAGPAGRLGVPLAASGRVVGLVVPDHQQRLLAPLGELQLPPV